MEMNIFFYKKRYQSCMAIASQVVHLFTGSTCDLLRIQYPRYYIKLLLELFKYDYAHLEQCVTDASHMKL